MTNNFNYSRKFRALTCNVMSCRTATRGGNRIFERQAQTSPPNSNTMKEELNGERRQLILSLPNKLLTSWKYARVVRHVCTLVIIHVTT